MRQLQSLLKIQPGEGRRVALMMIYSAAAMGGVLTVGLTVSDTLFLSQLPASAVPFMFILPAVSIIPALLVYSRIAGRFRLDQAIVGSNALLLGGVVLFRLLLATPYGSSFAVLAPLYLLEEIAYTLVILQFWSFAGQIFNPREARRLFGLIAAGGTLASIVAGFSLGMLVQTIGVANLLWMVAAALGICIFCARVLGRWQRTALSATPAAMVTAYSASADRHNRKSFREEARAIRQSPLLLAIGGLTILVSLLINVGAYEFRASLQINFSGRETELATFYGAFYFWTGLAALVMQSYVTGRVLSRVGVYGALLFFPLATALGAALSLLTGGALWAMTLVRAADPVFRRTINSAALNMLYLPTPADLQRRAKELFETLYAFTFGVAGVVFLILQQIPAWSYLYFSAPLLVLAGIWLGVLARVRRHYIRALSDSLKRRALDLESSPLKISDETIVRILIEALHHPDELRVLHALELMASAPEVDWDEHVVPLLDHSALPVRIRAIQFLGREGNLKYFDAVAAQLNAPEAEVRTVALESLYAIAASNAVAHLAACLDDEDPRVKAAAVIGLLRLGDSEIAQRAEAELTSMLQSDEPPLRQAGARAIGQAARPELHTQLAKLLDDAHRDVQLSAIQAAGALNSPTLVPRLIAKLDSPVTALAAVRALASYRDPIEAELNAALDNPAVAVNVPRILYRRRTPQAIELLLARFHVPGDALREEVYRALARWRAEGVEFPLAESAWRQAFDDEVRRGYELPVLREDLGASGRVSLFDDAFRARSGASYNRIFWLLAIAYPAHFRQIQQVRRALDTERGHTRARAVELLDNLADRQITEALLPLLEAPLEQVLDIAQRRFALRRCSLADRLAELARGADRWLSICAIFFIGSTQQVDLIEQVQSALRADDPLLRETALAAYRTLSASEGFTMLLAAHANDDPSPLVRR